MPNLRDMLESIILQGFVVISCLDLRAAFHSLPIGLDSRDYLTFTITYKGRQRRMRWVGSPFGLKFLPSHCQRVVSEVLSDCLNLGFLHLYMDDLVILSRSIDEHIKHLIIVFTKLTAANLRLQASKCVIGMTRLLVLGHILRAPGILTVDRSRLLAIQGLTTPTEPVLLRSYLGLVNWFSQFIPSLARFTGQLEKLRSIKDVATFRAAWKPVHTEQFNTSKRVLLGLPVLHPYDESKETFTASDASSYGVSAILWQLDDAKRVRLVALASRPLTAAETKYSIPKLEVLALVFTLRRFRRFVLGTRWLHYTDHQALVWLYLPRPPARILQGWQDELLEHEGLRIAHASGVANKLADLLSRLYGSTSAEVPTSEPPNPPPGSSITLIPDPRRVVIPASDESAQDELVYKLLDLKMPHRDDQSTRTAPAPSGLQRRIDLATADAQGATPSAGAIPLTPPRLLTYKVLTLPARDEPFDLTPLGAYDYAPPDVGRNIHPPGDQHVRTPPRLLEKLAEIFGPLHDVTPFHADEHGVDSLAVDYCYSKTRVNFANPPYGNIAPFAAKAVRQSTLGCTTVLLLPNRIDAAWYPPLAAVSQRYVFPRRIPFVGYGGRPAEFDSVLFIVRPRDRVDAPDLRDLGLFHDVEPEKCTVVVDPAAQRKLLEDAHKLGHFGASYLVNLVRYQQRRNWPGIHAHAKEVVSTCVSCLRFNVARRGFHPLTASTARLPWDAIAFDLFYVGVPSKRGHHYVLIIVDVATRVCFLVPLVGTTALETAQAIFRLCCILGFPKRMQHDGGPENSGPVIKEVVRLANATMRFTTPYNPSANGLPERFTRTARASINKRDIGAFEDWDLDLQPLQLVMNIGIDTSVGSQKFALFFARRHNPFDDHRDTEHAPLSPQELQERLHLMQDVVYPALDGRSKKAAARMEKSFNASHRLIEFAVGDHVMTRDPRAVKPKHESAYDGPFEVVSKNPDGTYTLRDHDGSDLRRNFVPQQLKRAAVRKNAAPVEPSYAITKIIDDRRGPDGETEFKVHWKGYAKSADSWISATQFDDTSMVQRYLKAKAPRAPHDRKRPAAVVRPPVQANAPVAPAPGPPLPRDRARRADAPRAADAPPRPRRSARVAAATAL